MYIFICIYTHIYIYIYKTALALRAMHLVPRASHNRDIRDRVRVLPNPPPCLGASWTAFEASWGPVGALLGFRGTVSGASGALSGAGNPFEFPLLGLSWGPLGLVFGAFEAVWDLPSGTLWKPKTLIFQHQHKPKEHRCLLRFEGLLGGTFGSSSGSGAVLGPFGAFLEGVGRLGALLGLSWAHFGASYGLLEALSGASWGPLGPLLGHLGALLGRLGALCGSLGPSWGDLGSPLGRLGAISEAPGAVLGRSWLEMTRTSKSPPNPKSN